MCASLPDMLGHSLCDTTGRVRVPLTNETRRQERISNQLYRLEKFVEKPSNNTRADVRMSFASKFLHARPPLSGVSSKR